MKPKRSRKKRLLTIFFTLGALLLFAVNAFLVWVVTGPRSLDWLTPYVESELNPPDGSYKIKIGSSYLSWDGWENPIAIHVKDVKMRDAKDVPVASFPDIGVRIKLFRLALGKLDIQSLEVNRPFVLLYQAEDGSLSLGFGEPTQDVTAIPEEPTATRSLPAALVAFASGDSGTPVERMKAISIRHARIAIKNKRSGVFFQTNDASLDLKRIWGRAEGSFTLPVQFENKTGKVQASLLVDANDSSIKANTAFSNVPSALLRQLFPAQEWMKAANMPLSGKAELKADFEGHVSSVVFTADAGPGVVEYPSQFDNKLDLKKIHLEGELKDRFTKFQLKSGLIDFGVVALNFDGYFRKEDEEYAVDANVHGAHIPIDELRNYWPKSLSPHTRAWVIERITKGEIEKAEVAIHFKPGELKLKNTPRDAIAAGLDIKGANVLYMPKNPTVNEVVGHIDFTGNSMQATVTSANYLTGTKITSADIKFPDLDAPDVQMFLDMNVIAPAIDVQTFLALPTLNKAKKLGLTEEITGKAQGNAKLDLIAFSENEEKNNAEVPDINYSLTATLEKVSQPQFLNKYDVSNADMQVEVTNKGIKATGKAELKKLPMSIVAESLFNKTHDTNYTIKTTMPVTRMPDFDLPKLDWLKGEMEIDASFISNDKEDKSKATIDITKVDVSLTDHGYIKKEGEKATLKLATEHLPNGNTLVPSFHLTGKDYEASGKAEIEKEKGDFKSIVFDKLTTGKHDLNFLDYQKTPVGFSVAARGRVFDLSPYRANMGKGGDTQGFVADITADKLILGEKHELFNVKAKLDCPDTCNSANVSAALSDKTPFTYTISNGEINSTCENAGELLRTLDIYEGMQGGFIRLKGKYEGKKIVGVVSAKDFTIKNAPILTRMFTIGSLTGVLDTLSGNGIGFDKLTAPYEYERGNIIVKDAKQYGSALGITANGAISLPTATYDLSGTLVPSYTLNSLVGKIPLVGDIIVGGTGKGLIALNYTVKGPMAEPSISANPLSVLTPGFTRGLFNIFDKPAPSMQQLEAAQKKAQDAENKEKTDK